MPWRPQRVSARRAESSGRPMTSGAHPRRSSDPPFPSGGARGGQREGGEEAAPGWPVILEGGRSFPISRVSKLAVSGRCLRHGTSQHARTCTNSTRTTRTQQVTSHVLISSHTLKCHSPGLRIGDAAAVSHPEDLPPARRHFVLPSSGRQRQPKFVVTTTFRLTLT